MFLQMKAPRVLGFLLIASCLCKLGAACSCDKKVKVEKFCITSDTGDAGPEGEYEIRLDSKKHYPLFSTDRCGDEYDCCAPSYCKLREGLCHNLYDSRFQDIESASSLVVGNVELDSTNQNDSAETLLIANEWYNPTCDFYEVQVAKPFSVETNRQVCWNVGASVGGNVKGVEGEINGGIQSCSTWTDPAESFIWLLR